MANFGVILWARRLCFWYCYGPIFLFCRCMAWISILNNIPSWIWRRSPEVARWAPNVWTMGWCCCVQLKFYSVVLVNITSSQWCLCVYVLYIESGNSINTHQKKDTLCRFSSEVLLFADFKMELFSGPQTRQCQLRLLNYITDRKKCCDMTSDVELSLFIHLGQTHWPVSWYSNRKQKHKIHI